MSFDYKSAHSLGAKRLLSPGQAAILVPKFVAG